MGYLDKRRKELQRSIAQLEGAIRACDRDIKEITDDRSGMVAQLAKDQSELFELDGG